MRLRRAFRIGVGVAFALALGACAHQPSPIPGAHEPGFFEGLFNGFLAPITLLLGWWWHGRIYAFPNNGWWYDAGFVLGILAVAGGSVHVSGGNDDD